MANRQRAALNLLHRKELKQLGKPVNSKFGAPGNLRKRGPKIYGKQKNNQVALSN